MLAAAGGLTRLTELSLRGCPAVTNAVAALLERLPALHSVDLRACEHVTGERQGATHLRLTQSMFCSTSECLSRSFEYPACFLEHRDGITVLGCVLTDRKAL